MELKPQIRGPRNGRGNIVDIWYKPQKWFGNFGADALPDFFFFSPIVFLL